MRAPFLHVVRPVLAIAATVAVVSVATSCTVAAKDTIDRKVSTRASPGSFRTNGVSTVFEKRCGSLDCHGSLSRNMRIYSSSGLRLPNDAGLTPGNGATTLDEITANYHSIMTVEPEQTNVVAEGGDPYSLLILKKPLLIEHHKGGQTLRRGDDAELCISSWLTEDLLAPINTAACANAANYPK
jgi:hypothetical protein